MGTMAACIQDYTGFARLYLIRYQLVVVLLLRLSTSHVKSVVCSWIEFVLLFCFGHPFLLFQAYPPPFFFLALVIDCPTLTSYRLWFWQQIIVSPTKTEFWCLYFWIWVVTFIWKCIFVWHFKTVDMPKEDFLTSRNFFSIKAWVFSFLPPFLFIKSMDLADVVFRVQSKPLYKIYCVDMTKVGPSDLCFITDLIFVTSLDRGIWMYMRVLLLCPPPPPIPFPRRCMFVVLQHWFKMMHQQDQNSSSDKVTGFIFKG